MHTLRVLALLTLCFLTVPNASAQQSALTFKETTYDFGALQQGKEGRHVFTFRNTGTQAFRLARVQPSCGCTTPHWTHRTFAPGDTGHVAAVFDSEGQAGHFRKTIRVVSDQTSKPAILTIQGRVKLPPIEDGMRMGNLLVEQQTVDLGAIPEGERGRHAVRVKNESKHPIKITDIETPSNMVSAYVPDDPIYVGRMDEITVLVRAYVMKAGDSFSYPITLVTDDPQQPKKTIRVVGSVTK